MNQNSIIAKLNTTNTVDDIRQSIQFCEQNSISKVTLITSDFHISRVKILFDTYNKTNLTLENIEASITNKKIPSILKLMEHEYRAIRVLNGQPYD